jgi:hypothetical protein
MKTHYEWLNLPSTATTDEILAAYTLERARCIAEGGDDSAVKASLQSLDEAYAVLSDPGQRAAYDRSLQSPAAMRSLAFPGQSIPTELPAVISASPQAPVVQHTCPRCGALNPIQATICRACGNQVSRPCPHCSQPIRLDQTVCPRCATYVPEYDQRRFAQGLAVERQINEERRMTDARTVAADQVYRSGVRLGLVFWSVVGVLCFALAILTVLASNYLSR